MDDARFDALVQRVASGASRRRLMSGLLAGAVALTGAVAGVSDSAAKKGKGKGKKKGHGKGKNNGGGKGKGKGRTKVFICHKGKVLHVASPSLKGHLGHGDTECGEAGACQTGDPTSCDKETGACTFESLPEDTECLTEEGASGTCDAAGVCVATPVCGGAGDPCELSEDCCDGFSCESLTCTAI